MNAQWNQRQWVSRRPMPGEVLHARWKAGCDCDRRGSPPGTCNCSWRGRKYNACMTFVVLASDEPGSSRWLTATCVPLEYNLQEELASTYAYCYKVGVPFRCNDMQTPIHNAELIAEGPP